MDTTAEASQSTEQPCKETVQADSPSLIHPLIRSHAWDPQMARTNALALDPEEYMCKMKAAKESTISKLHERLSNINLEPTIGLCSLHPSQTSLVSATPTSVSGPVSVGESVNGHARNISTGTLGVLEYEDKPDSTIRLSAGAAATITSRSKLPHQDLLEQPNRITRNKWELAASMLLPKSVRRKASFYRNGASSSGTTKAPTNNHVAATESEVIPPPHRLHKMPSFTAIDDNIVLADAPPAPLLLGKTRRIAGSLKRNKTTGSQKLATKSHSVLGNEEDENMENFPINKHNLKSTPKYKAEDVNTHENTSADTCEKKEARNSIHSRPESGSISFAVPSRRSSYSASLNRLSSGLDTTISLTETARLSGNHTHSKSLGTAASDNKVLKEADSSKIQPNFSSRPLNFNHPALQNPAKMSRAQLVVAEDVYEENMEKMRLYAIERAKATKENRPCKAALMPHSYICASKPGDNFKLVYNVPSNDEVESYAGNLKSELHGLTDCKPKSYLDQIPVHMIPDKAHDGKNIKNWRQPSVPRSLKNRDTFARLEHSCYEDPRPAPAPPLLPSTKYVYPTGSVHGPKALQHREKPPPLMRDSEKAHPLLQQTSIPSMELGASHLLSAAAFPPLEPGAIRRLSQEKQLLQEQVQQAPSVATEQLSPPAAITQATSRFENAAAELRTHVLSQQSKESLSVPTLRCPSSLETVTSGCSLIASSDDQLSTIDEKSESRSAITAYRVGLANGHFNCDLSMLTEGKAGASCEDLIRAIKVQGLALQQSPDSSPVRSHSDPSMAPLGEGKQVGADSPEFARQTSCVSNCEERLAQPPFAKQTPSIAELLNRALPPLPLRTSSDSAAQTSPQKRAKSFSDLKTASAQNIARFKASPKAKRWEPYEFGPGEGVLRRMHMRNHQSSFLALDHAAFGGPPHRDLQSGLCKDQALLEPAELIPNKPLVENASSTKLPPPLTTADVNDRCKGAEDHSKPLNSTQKVTYNCETVSVIDKTNDSDASTRPSSFATPKKMPREAGYAVSPLRTCPTDSHAQGTVTCNSAGNSQDDSGLQDFLQAINMDPDDIDKGRSGRLSTEGSLTFPRNFFRSADSTITKKHGSYRSESVRASSSIRDFFKPSFHPYASFDNSRTCEKEHQLEGTTVSGDKLDTKDEMSDSRASMEQIRSVMAVHVNEAVVQLQEAQSHASTNCKASPSFFQKLKSKASLDVLRHKGSLARLRKYHAPISSDMRKVAEDQFRTLDQHEQLFIPPLPQLSRLTLTMTEEEMKSFGAGHYAMPNAMHVPSTDLSQREFHRKETLERLGAVEPRKVVHMSEAEKVGPSSTISDAATDTCAKSTFTVRKAVVGAMSPPPRLVNVGRSSISSPQVPFRVASKQVLLEANTQILQHQAGPAPHQSHKPVPRTKTVRKLPSYGIMPVHNNVYGPRYTPIDITKHATADPKEALSSEATVMSLAPKAGASRHLQEKSRLIASALTSHLPESTGPLDSAAAPSSCGRATPVGPLRSVVSAEVLAPSFSQIPPPRTLKKKKSLGNMLRAAREE